VTRRVTRVEVALRSAVQAFAPAQQTLYLIQIVEALDGELGALGDQPASATFSDELGRLREWIPRSDAGRQYWAARFQEVTAELARVLQTWLDDYLQRLRAQPDSERNGHRVDVATRAKQELQAWALLERSAQAPVDFDALLQDVLDSEGMRADAANVGLKLEVLSEQIRSRQADIEGQAKVEIAALLEARDQLGSAIAERSTLGGKGPVQEAGAVGAQPPAYPSDGRVVSRLAADLLQVAAVADEVVSRAIEYEARRRMTDFATNLRRTQLQLASVEGLAQVIDERLEIRTAACQQLAGLLTRMRGGSVGIAGPRGAGKSTMMRRFHDGRERIGDRPLLAVMVSAPVSYDSRDFMLMLFAEVCKQAGAEPPPPEQSDDQLRGLDTVVLGWAVGWLPILGIFLALVGASALVAAVQPKLNSVIAWGVASIVGGIVIGSRRLGRVIPDVPWRRDNLLARLASAPIAWGVLGLLIGGVILTIAGLRGANATAADVRSLGFIYGGLLVAVIASDLGYRHRDHTWYDRYSSERREDQLRFRLDELASAASVRLLEIRYQQTLTSGLEGKLTLGGAVGLEIGASRERSLARHPMTFPEVVNSFASFMTLAAKTRDVLIAIDELDKLPAKDETATRFLNDLKAVFGVGGTYFLVSVSEDAMSRFQRRGLPFRDVFDSTFDEIIHVEPMGLSEAQALLSARVVGMPYVYSALCDVLAGGIPRDLIRTARRIVDVNERLGKPDSLGKIVQHLMQEELSAKSDGVQFAATALEGVPQAQLDAFLAWLREFRDADGPDGLVKLRLLSEKDILQNTAADESEMSAVHDLLRLAAELRTYGYFVATVLEFFDDALKPDDVEAAANGTKVPHPTLELLANARAGFGVSVQTAKRGIDAFRAAANLGPLP
jgi:hypothetical protein